MNNIEKRIIATGLLYYGKSIFLRKLLEVTAIPLIHLDKEFWNDGWGERNRNKQIIIFKNRYINNIKTIYKSNC